MNTLFKLDIGTTCLQFNFMNLTIFIIEPNFVISQIFVTRSYNSCYCLYIMNWKCLSIMSMQKSLKSWDNVKFINNYINKQRLKIGVFSKFPSFTKKRKWKPYYLLDNNTQRNIGILIYVNTCTYYGLTMFVNNVNVKVLEILGSVKSINNKISK
jgi:hypothetical protein